MQTGKRPRIVLVHAVQVAMAPVETAFQQLWPEAERVNILDDSLSVDRGQSPDLTPAMYDRFHRMGAYARDIGADGVLFTCSAFGEAIESVARELPVPVLKPNEAMFEDALGKGAVIGLIATFERSVPMLEAEMRDMAAQRGQSVTLHAVCEPAAMQALQSGDEARHNALMAEAATRLPSCDAVLLAQFSTSVAQSAVSARVSAPVLTSPGSAVKKMKSALSL
ncbi:MAG: aspartate/glutamate racemase family protein [Hyphomicrobiaceae bacterium]